MISDERLAEIERRLPLLVESFHPASAWYRQDVPDLLAALRAEREALAEIRAVVNAQADDPGLWPIYAMGEQRITEAYLQQELRRLHAVVERVTPDPKEPA